jgi:hypothetical protein
MFEKPKAEGKQERRMGFLCRSPRFLEDHEEQAKDEVVPVLN